MAIIALIVTSPVWADGTAPVPGGGLTGGGAGPRGEPSMMGMLFPFALMFGVIYFLMIRPQQKKMKKHQEMLSQLKHGDDVITASGILGTIAGITDKVVTLDLGENVRVKMLKNQISRISSGSVEDLA